jgi:3'(2'), 5'-bisphosphate nucleotidase
MAREHGSLTPLMVCQCDIHQLVEIEYSLERTGTQTFLRGQQYCINVALLENGVEQLGIIGCPNLSLSSTTAHEDEVDKNGLGLMIFALRGKGTWVRPMQQGSVLAEPFRIDRHGDSASLDKLIWSDCSTYTSTIGKLHQDVATKLGIAWPGVDLYSSVLKYAALGLGRSDICIRIYKYRNWRSNM